MKRREVITLIVGAAAAWPLTARAQQSPMPVIGFVSATARDENRVTAFRSGLHEAGYDEGRNVAIEYRWAEGQIERAPRLVADLVARQVTVIVAAGSTPVALAAKAATSTIPIVFNMGGDPVKFGLVTSLNRPGGNVTGVSFLVNLMGAKRFELLHQMVPGAAPIGYLVNPSSWTAAESERAEVEEAARALGHPLLSLHAKSESEIDEAFAKLVREQVRALIIEGDPFFYDRRQQLATLAARHAVPVVYPLREYVAAGGLMSYGTNFAAANRQTGVYVGKILKGAQPADLPVMQSTQFELVLNLTTAKALGLQLPDRLLALADEVIE
jgi:putative tryptophan/tyrosine transport system substrate-binding protein